MQPNAQVLVQPGLQALQVFKVLEVFQPLDQALLLLAGEQEDALGRRRLRGQVLAAAVTGARWARLA
ncbi:hypothetical protein D3C80_2043540 [compost metagenome]